MTSYNPSGLEGRVALVTGATSGLGLVAATALAAAGAHVVAVSRDRDRAESVRRTIGDDTEAVIGDVGEPGGAQRIIEAATESNGCIDVLVNGAGVMQRGAIEDTSDADFYEMIRVNTFGVWAMCREALSAMRPAGGSIINIASAAGVVGYDTRAAYGASKGAVIQLTRCLAVEFARDQIRVNAVAPGPFRSGMASERGTAPQLQALLTHRVPLARMAEPGELGGAITFLAGATASFITGIVLPVDGGWTAA
jgi:gluconate 5-dehydrogenase